MESQITLRHDAPAAMNFVNLGMVAGYHSDSGPDCGTIAEGPNQLEFDPIVLIPAVIAQERRWIIHIQNQDIDVSIVVKIPVGTAAAGEPFADTRPHLS